MDLVNDKFVDYVFGFYGPGGLYPLGASKQDIADATDTHKAILRAQGKEFCGDSIDREMVRDILTELYGLGQEPGQLELPFDAWQSSVRVPGNRDLIKEI